MDATEMANSPVEITANGKAWKVARLSIGEIYGVIGAEIKTEALATIRELASGLAPGDRASFTQLAMKEIPSGRRLEEAVADRMGTMAGVFTLLRMGLRKLQSATDDEIRALVESQEGGAIVEHLLGLPASKKDDKGDASPNALPPPAK